MVTPYVENEQVVSYAASVHPGVRDALYVPEQELTRIETTYRTDRAIISPTNPTPLGEEMAPEPLPRDVVVLEMEPEGRIYAHLKRSGERPHTAIASFPRREGPAMEVEGDIPWEDILSDTSPGELFS